MSHEEIEVKLNEEDDKKSVPSQEENMNNESKEKESVRKIDIMLFDDL